MITANIQQIINNYRLARYLHEQQERATTTMRIKLFQILSKLMMKSRLTCLQYQQLKRITIPHINTIDVKYMESGHSYLECDSIHSFIERKKKNLKIYSTQKLGMQIQTARINHKRFNTRIIDYCEFFNSKKVSTSIINNANIDTEGENVQWLKIKMMRFEKGCNEVLFKYNYEDDFLKLQFQIPQKTPARKSKKKKDVLVHINPCF